MFGIPGIDPPEQFRGIDLFQENGPETVYATIGFGEPDSYAMPNGGVGKFENGRGRPRRACIREGTYRLDMSIKQDGKYVDNDQEDVFFVDTAVCPKENQNMASDPHYQETVAKLRKK